MASSRRESDPPKKPGDDATGLSDRLVTVVDPTSAAAEAYRLLRTNLLYAVVDAPPEVVVLTSPGPGEGKSVTCANLGITLAYAEKDTLIVDCDLREPVMHRIFDKGNTEGLVNVLAGERNLWEASQPFLPRLRVLTAGPATSSAAELLDSERFAEFLYRAREQFDYVLLDAPPMEGVSDPVILATRVDGVLMVLDAQNTRKGALRQAIRRLEAIGATVLGTVMNRVEGSKASHYFEG